MSPVVLPPPNPQPRISGSPADETFILGAGFSRAISDALPLLYELGSTISTRLSRDYQGLLAYLPDTTRRQLSEGHPPGGNLEAWLSHLASRPPFLDEIETRYNSGLYLKIIDLISSDITLAQSRAIQSPIPCWLIKLVNLWSVNRPTILSFNYDNLVEYAVKLNCLGRSSDLGRVEREYILGVIPPPAGPSAISPTDVRRVTFQLVKLHGSLDWTWRHDSVGESIRRGGREPWAGQSTEVPAEGSAFLVPPVASKSDYYDVGPVRALWQTAAKALQASSKVTFMGFSMPVTDLVTRNLIAYCYSAAQLYTVVDLCPGRILDSLRELGIRFASCFSGASAISQFVDQYEEETALRAWPATRSEILSATAEDASLPLLARVPPRTDQGGVSYLPVTDVRSENSTLILSTSGAAAGGSLDIDRALESAVPFHQLRSAVDQLQANRLRLQLGDSAMDIFEVQIANFNRRAWLVGP